MTYITELLNPDHNRSGFKCGEKPLDTYIQKIVKQDKKRYLSFPHVLVEEGTNKIIGYYTLSGLSIPSTILPENITSKLPSGYDNLPAVLLGRLAVDLTFQKQGHGEALLIDAMQRVYDLTQSSIGAMAIAVDPINDEAENFYKQYGFINLPDRGRMFLPMGTVKILLGGA